MNRRTTTVDKESFYLPQSTLIIGGTIGAGKSFLLNSILNSLFFHGVDDITINKPLNKILIVSTRIEQNNQHFARMSQLHPSTVVFITIYSKKEININDYNTIILDIDAVCVSTNSMQFRLLSEPCAQVKHLIRNINEQKRILQTIITSYFGKSTSMLGHDELVIY